MYCTERKMKWRIKHTICLTVLAFIILTLLIYSVLDSVSPAEYELTALRVQYELLKAKHEKCIAELDTKYKEADGLSNVVKHSIQSNLKDHYSAKTLVKIFIVTPTYARPVQKAELTRLSQTLMLVPNIHWIVVEDRANTSSLVSKLLVNSGLPHTHLTSLTPDIDKLEDDDPRWSKPRGVSQRNTALHWLRSKYNNTSASGVLYFADDDNTYDIRLFEEMRTTMTVSVWPVGLVGKLLYEAPICQHGRVTGWRTYWKPERAFALDMAGFAVNLQLLINRPEVMFPKRVRIGELESDFLSQLVTRDQLEPKAKNCTQVLVWHTRTEKANLRNEDKLARTRTSRFDKNIEV